MTEPVHEPTPLAFAAEDWRDDIGLGQIGARRPASFLRTDDDQPTPAATDMLDNLKAAINYARERYGIPPGGGYSVHPWHPAGTRTRTRRRIRIGWAWNVHDEHGKHIAQGWARKAGDATVAAETAWREHFQSLPPWTIRARAERLQRDRAYRRGQNVD